MAFSEQSFGVFQDAKDAASNLLLSQEKIHKPLSYPDAVILLAASHLIVDKEFEGFTITQIKDLSRISYPSVATSLTWFTDKVEVFEAHSEKLSNRGRPTKIFAPTGLGRTTLDLFQTSCLKRK